MDTINTIDTTDRVDARDFCADSGRYLDGDRALTIERAGTPVGLYIPVHWERRESTAAAFARLEAAIERVLEETGMTEDELADWFDLTKSLPDEPA